MNPEISVITTVYNGGKYLEESIKSILEQTFSNFEYIIVNDGSADNTAEFISKYAGKDKRIVCIDNLKNAGRVKSLNIALSSAKGNFIAIQDADDISLPERLSKQISFLKENPEYVLVGSDVSVINDKGEIISNPIRPEEDPEIKFSLIFRCTFANPSIMYSKKVLSEFGILYEENFLHAEDFRIISLISRHGRIHNLREKLIYYRRHENNNSSVNIGTLNSASIEIIRENLSQLGFSLKHEQVKRIRNLISSRGIDSNFLEEDVKLIFEIIKKFQNKYNNVRNEEVLKTLKRMTGWLGRKNIITKPGYMKLHLYILTYYFKLANFTK